MAETLAMLSIPWFSFVAQMLLICSYLLNTFRWTFYLSKTISLFTKFNLRSVRFSQPSRFPKSKIACVCRDNRWIHIRHYKCTWRAFECERASFHLADHTLLLRKRRNFKEPKCGLKWGSNLPYQRTYPIITRQANFLIVNHPSPKITWWRDFAASASGFKRFYFFAIRNPNMAFFITINSRQDEDDSVHYNVK